MSWNPPVKVEEFLCECGCQQMFWAGYTRRKPRYANATHHKRALADRKRVQREKLRAQGIHQVKYLSAEKRAPSLGGGGGVRGGGEGPITPALTTTTKNGSVDSFRYAVLELLYRISESAARSLAQAARS